MAAEHVAQKWPTPALEPSFTTIFIRGEVQKGQIAHERGWLEPTLIKVSGGATNESSKCIKVVFYNHPPITYKI